MTARTVLKVVVAAVLGAVGLWLIFGLARTPSTSPNEGTIVIDPGVILVGAYSLRSAVRIFRPSHATRGLIVEAVFAVLLVVAVYMTLWRVTNIEDYIVPRGIAEVPSDYWLALAVVGSLNALAWVGVYVKRIAAHLRHIYLRLRH